MSCGCRTKCKCCPKRKHKYSTQRSDPHYKLIHRKLYVVPPNLNECSPRYYRAYVLDDGTMAYLKDGFFFSYYLEPPKGWTQYAFIWGDDEVHC